MQIEKMHVGDAVSVGDPAQMAGGFYHRDPPADLQPLGKKKVERKAASDLPWGPLSPNEGVT